ncbi:MAG: monovalent cation/H+ antiporter subunit D family protein [Gammaproteobacteria bacterium]|nr:monovalent cation/H+ antiporter subunit D family protein [Gammaproteobacteria bacterium]
MSAWAQHLPALQVGVPLLTTPIIVLLRPHGLSWAAATLTSCFTFFIAVMLTVAVLQGQQVQYSMGAWPAPHGIALSVDAFSAILLLIVTGASTVALLAARQIVNAEIEASRQPLFYTAWLLALAGFVGILVSADAFNIFVFMEISSLASYVLIAGGSDRRALPAVFKYLVMGTIGATFYLIGIGLIYLMTGTLNLADMEVRIREVSDQKPILVAAGFITIGLALKAAVFPLHLWLPNAYTYAPVPVTVFLAACSTKVSLYLLLRFDFFLFQPNLLNHNIQFSYFIMPLAILAILAASSLAMFERNLKRLLAYSSIAQVGYILLGASLVSLIGLTASVIHMFNHALAKAALFLCVACLATRCANLRIDSLRGVAKQMPWTMAAFLLAGLSLIGVPGTAGFISKWYLITAALDEGLLGVGLIVVVAAGSLMAVYYLWRVIEAAYFGKTNEGAEIVGEAPLGILVVCWLVVLSNYYFGLAPSLPTTLSSAAAQILLGQVP